MFNPIQNDTLLQIIRRGCQIITGRTEGSHATNIPCPTGCVRTACADTPFATNACAPTSCTAYKGLFDTIVVKTDPIVTKTDPIVAKTDASTSMNETKAPSNYQTKHSKSTCTASVNPRKIPTRSFPNTCRSCHQTKDCGCPIVAGTPASRSKTTIVNIKRPTDHRCCNKNQNISPTLDCGCRSKNRNIPQTLDPCLAVTGSSCKVNVSGSSVVEENLSPGSAVPKNAGCFASPGRYVNENFLNIPKPVQKPTPCHIPGTSFTATNVSPSKPSTNEACDKPASTFCDPCASILKPITKQTHSTTKPENTIFLPGQLVNNKPTEINVKYVPKSLDEDLPANIEFLLEAEMKKKLEPPKQSCSEPLLEQLPETSDRKACQSKTKMNVTINVTDLTNKVTECISATATKISHTCTKLLLENEENNISTTNKVTECIAATAAKISETCTKLFVENKESKISTSSANAKLPPIEKTKPVKLTTTRVHTFNLPCKIKPIISRSYHSEKHEIKPNISPIRTRSREGLNEKGNSSNPSSHTSRSTVPQSTKKDYPKDGPKTTNDIENTKTLDNKNIKVTISNTSSKANANPDVTETVKNIKVTISNTSSKANANPDVKETVKNIKVTISNTSSKANANPDVKEPVKNIKVTSSNISSKANANPDVKEPVKNIKVTSSNISSKANANPNVKETVKNIKVTSSNTSSKANANPEIPRKCDILGASSKTSFQKDQVTKTVSKKRIKKRTGPSRTTSKKQINPQLCEPGSIPERPESIPEPPKSVPEPVELIPEPLKLIPEPLECITEPLELTPEPLECIPDPIELIPVVLESIPKPPKWEPEPPKCEPEPEPEPEPDYSNMEPPNLFKEEAEERSIRCKNDYKELTPIETPINKIFQATVSNTTKLAESLQLPNCRCVLKPPSCPCEDNSTKVDSKNVDTAVLSGSIPGKSLPITNTFERFKVSLSAAVAAVAASHNSNNPCEPSKITESEIEPEINIVLQTSNTIDPTPQTIKVVEENITCSTERKPRRYPTSSTRLSSPCLLFRRPPAKSMSLHRRRSFVPDCPCQKEKVGSEPKQSEPEPEEPVSLKPRAKNYSRSRLPPSSSQKRNVNDCKYPKKSKHDLNRKKAGCEDGYESSSSFGSEFSYSNFNYNRTNKNKDFIACLNVSKFKPDEIHAKIVNDATIYVEGKHDDRLEHNGIVARTFTRKYILSKDYDPNKVEITMYKDKILKIKVPGPINIEAPRVVPIHLRNKNATIKKSTT